MKNNLKIANLSFQFAKDKPFFFHNLSASFEAGKIHAIYGRNGSGKSTLFRLLQGHLMADDVVSGQIQLGDHVISISSSEKSAFNRIKMVSQKFDSMLADQLSFIENLKLASLNEFPTFGTLPKHQPLPDFLKRFDIDMHKPVRLLSGGQRQILAILMVLQKPCSVLLLDEPTAALDDQNAAMVMEFVRNLVQTMGMTMIMICHDKELAQRYADTHVTMQVVGDERRLVTA